MTVFVTTEHVRAADRTFAGLPDDGQTAAWKRKAQALAPVGTDDRTVEQRLRKAGLTVEPAQNHAYAVKERSDCARWIEAKWTLDADGRLNDLQTWSGGGCS
ncbi:hypothetical protein [Caulobacter sp. 17J65-9]|uniref:hypothetical protein n=1 Tax=Caulobacter sp. 17J65-9 TaxID=2709382 RepID=UPI0013D3BA9A|nr:hypothetical protein [Caulobacter sp. 17J65-9]